MIDFLLLAGTTGEGREKRRRIHYSRDATRGKQRQQASGAAGQKRSGRPVSGQNVVQVSLSLSLSLMRSLLYPPLVHEATGELANVEG